MNIDPEFRSLCPALSLDEGAQLEANLLAEGCRDPLVVWNGTLLDGHHRHLICTAHDLEFATVEVTGVSSREEATAWIIRNQLGRRNLTPEQASYLRGKQYNAEKRPDGGHGDQRSGYQNDTPKTRDRLAAEHNVSGPTISRDGAFAAAVDAIAENVGPGARERILDRETRLPKEAVIEISRAHKDEQRAIMAADGAAAIQQQIRRARIARAPEPKLLDPGDLPTKRYRCIVIDPPWPMQKIGRDVRPNQVVMDYPTMSEKELQAFGLPGIADEDCHLYLWTTHKFLPMALRLTERWGFRYQCLLTWVKNVGITPFSWMYSTEHVVFARKGNLDLLQLGKRLDFSAKVREHSRKPDVFYDLVRDVSPGPRIDVFSREMREGFDQYGDQTGHFAEAESA